MWVLSGTDGKIVVLDARTGEVVRRETTREGGSAVAAGFKSIWALKERTGSLLRFRRSSGDRIGAIRILAEGLPNIVATGERAVWVGVRKRPPRDGAGESLVRVDPSLNPPEQEAVPMPGGVGDLAVGEGAVWVTNTYSSSVTRVDPRNLKNMRPIKVGGVPNGVAVGEGAVWVAVASSKALARINPRTRRRTATIPLGVVPTRVAVGGGSVWVTAQGANKLFRIDPKTLKLREPPIETGSEPFALDVTDGHYVYVTLTDEVSGGGVQRVRFYP